MEKYDEEKSSEKSINILFLHGYESSGTGFKAEYFRKIFPSIHTPTLSGDLNSRMEQILPLFQKYSRWFIIGSSFGGLMATILAQKYTQKIERLILLAPALIPPFFSFDISNGSAISGKSENFNKSLKLIKVKTDIIHGKQDSVVPFHQVKKLAEKLFINLTYHEVNDDHRLHTTTKSIDWKQLLFPS
ncbi:alpha/beta fold hydrolase [Candidatus Harpocratesius sp.]